MMEFFQKNILLFVVISLGIAFLFSVLINSILLKFSQTLGARQAEQREIRWSPSVRPSLGGISFFVVFLVTFIVLDFIGNIMPIHFSNLKVIGIFVVCTIAFLMGLADDAYNTKPLLKFITQFVCGLVLYFTDTKINIFTDEAFNFAFTLIWVVGLMNSINMLDNMDGITTIVSIVIISFIIAINLHLHTILTPVPILCLGVLGSLLGFLIYNWHPSKMFMGDTGSQFLGAFLSVVGIDFCWNASSLANNTWYSINPILLGFTVVTLVFILPLTDTVTVTINRLSRGQSPFVGGKDHTTHHLFFKGVTEKRISVLFFVIGTVGIVLALHVALNYQLSWLILSIIFCSITFLSLYLNTIIKRK